MKTKDLKDKKVNEVMKLALDKKDQLRAIRSNLSGSKSKNVKEIANLRKEIARALTELNARKDK